MAQETRVADVRPNSMNFDLTVRVHRVGAVQEIPDKSGMGRRPNRLVEAVVGDASGNVVMSLWNHEVERVAAGDCLRIREAYVKLVRGQIRVSVGRGGAIEKAADDVQGDPGLPSISDAKHQDDRPRNPRPRFGGPARPREGFGERPSFRDADGASTGRRSGDREWTPRPSKW
jgi:replication factor A1